MRRRLYLGTLVGLVALVGAACAPLTGVSTATPPITTATYRIGPFNLAAMGQPGWESDASQINVPRPPGNVGIKTVSFDLVDGSGTPISRMDAHLHHVLLMNNAHTSPICAGEKERFTGAGAERTPLSLWGSYAYLTSATDRWDSLWHVMNMSMSPKTIYIQYKVGYVPASDASASRPVTPFFMDVTGCGTNAEFNVPGNGGRGSIFTKSRSITAPWNGVAVYAGGHLHDGGVDLSIRRNSTGQVPCTTVANYNPPGMMGFPSSISACPLHNSVNAGEGYTLTARYDNSAPHAAVMGIMLAYIWKGTPPAG